MTDATDLLASINLYPYEPSSNPGGLSGFGYLAEVEGVSLVARVARAMGTATREVENVAIDLTQPRADQAAINALVAPAETDAEAADNAAQAAYAELGPPTIWPGF